MTVRRVSRRSHRTSQRANHDQRDDHPECSDNHEVETTLDWRLRVPRRVGLRCMTVPMAAARARGVVSRRLISNPILPLTNCQGPEDAWSRRPGANRNTSRMSTCAGLRRLALAILAGAGVVVAFSIPIEAMRFGGLSLFHDHTGAQRDAVLQRLSDVVAHWTRRSPCRRERNRHAQHRTRQGGDI